MSNVVIDPPVYHRRVIKITAEDSPNVKLALAEMGCRCWADYWAKKQSGEFVPQPSRREVVPGVIGWDDYEHARLTWDEQRQSWGLDAEFWQGAQVMVFPPAWLDRAARIAERNEWNPAEAIGIDAGEGSADTSLAVVGRRGLIDLISVKTPDTSVIPEMAVDLMRQHGVPAESVGADAGGGGKQLGDRLRRMGFPIRLIRFGGEPQRDLKRSMTFFGERREERDAKAAYVNRRAQMYYEFAELLSPLSERGFGIPARFAELRRQLSKMPRLEDQEGRLFMLPKNPRPGSEGDGRKLKSLTELLGRSPDDADAVVVAAHVMLHQTPVARAGAMR